MTLRPLTAADEPFLRSLDRAVGAQALPGLPAEHRDAVLERQFTTTRRLARTAKPPWREQVIERDGAPVGWLATTRDAEGVELLRIDVMPDHQASGVGSAALDAMLRAADADGVTVRTRVLVTNPRARAWYARRGFAPVHGDEVMLRLERRPGAGSGTS